MEHRGRDRLSPLERRPLPGIRRALIAHQMRQSLDDRTRLWRQIRPHVAGLAKVKPRGIGEWDLELGRIVSALRGFDPATAFPQVPPQPSLTRFKADLIREAHAQLSRAQGAEPATVNQITARMLRKLCPELCSDLTPEGVRKLVAYHRKK